MNIYLSTQLASSRQADILADAERERLVRESRVARRSARRARRLRPTRLLRPTVRRRNRVPA
jgi:hypothetical protein